ncbi:MAG: hypothetical protein GY778_13645 [bacterium]|nr:hypothetical protein [bacterium]
MAEKLGMECVLNYKIGGITGGGSWIALTNVKDVTAGLEQNEADATTRANAGWRATVAALKSGTLEFDMVWDTADAGFTAIKNAFFGATAALRKIGMQVLDGAGGEGLQADWNVMKFDRNEPLEEVVTVSVSMKITYSDTAPSWIGGA